MWVDEAASCSADQQPLCLPPERVCSYHARIWLRMVLKSLSPWWSATGYWLIGTNIVANLAMQVIGGCWQWTGYLRWLIVAINFCLKKFFSKKFAVKCTEKISLPPGTWNPHRFGRRPANERRATVSLKADRYHPSASDGSCQEIRQQPTQQNQIND